ncbi:hypothetical protein ACFYZJ_24710 [Streptomyces sp. NPDC001848]|uniref:hypothetical protein n=1 Tax=Streptomyces sp. NPDC001848 TaxID=3364618 RepID=UPI0036AAFF23
MSRTHGFAIATSAVSMALLSPMLLSPMAGAAVPARTGGNQSPQQLAAQAERSLRNATSVRLRYEDRSATATSSNRLPTSMDLTLDRAGNCAGTMTLGGHGGTVQIVKRGTDVWLKPDAAFWKAEYPGRRGIDLASTFSNRYIHGTTTSNLLNGIASSCDLRELQQVAKVSAPTSVKEGLATSLNGTRVVPLSFKVNGFTSTLYVTTGKEHRLYRAAQKGPDTDLSLTFTGYNVPVPKTTPPASRTVDISRVPQPPRS